MTAAGRDHSLYPLTTNLLAGRQKGDDDDTSYVCGPGVVLHFRYQAFWLAWAFLCLVATVMLSWRYDRFQAAEAMMLTPMHDEAFEECASFNSKDIENVNRIQVSATQLTLVIYILTTIMCLLAAIVARRTFRKDQDKEITMGDYALMVMGMPVENPRDTIEEDYLKFFQKEWGPCVIGVSICWDFGEKQEEVMGVATSVMHQYDRKFDKDFLSPQDIAAYQEERETMKATHHLEEGYEDGRTSCCHPELRCIDNLCLGRSYDEDVNKREIYSARPHHANLKLLASLKTTGHVFVVFQTEKDAFDSYNLPTKPVYEGKTLIVRNDKTEPFSVHWHNFSVSSEIRTYRILTGIGFLALIIVVWAVFFYGPYVMYILSWTNVPGKSMGSNLTNTLLGLLAVPGNQIVYYTCAMIAEKAGFRNQEKTHTFNVCLYTFAVFVNIVVDLALLLILAHGYIQDQASGLDATATIRNPSFQHALFIQLVGYLYPGTLLAPYLFEPIPMNIAPYYLGKWMVRSALHVTRYEAEQCLVCPPFDLLRYGDITINVMLVIMCFFLTAQALWWVFMWLFISLAVIYAWDHYRFLRQTQRTQFASDKMKYAASTSQLSLVLFWPLLLSSSGMAAMRSWSHSTFI
jgi:hypothetical protein